MIKRNHIEISKILNFVFGHLESTWRVAYLILKDLIVFAELKAQRFHASSWIYFTASSRLPYKLCNPFYWIRFSHVHGSVSSGYIHVCLYGLFQGGKIQNKFLFKNVSITLRYLLKQSYWLWFWVSWLKASARTQ